MNIPLLKVRKFAFSLLIISFIMGTLSVDFLKMNVHVHADSSSDNTILLEENFNDIKDGSLPSGWTVTGEGTFEVNNGKLKGSSDTNLRVVFGEADWKNYSFEADVTFQEVMNSSRYVALMYRASEDGEEPYYQYAKRQRGEYEMAYRTPEASWDVKKRVSDIPEMKIGETHRLKVDVYGGIVRQYFDDELLFEENLATELDNGKLGFQVNKGEMEFDNVKVSELEAVDYVLEGLPESLDQYKKYPYEIKAQMNDDTAIDISDQAEVTSNDPTIADVKNGEIRTKKAGTVDFTISYEGIESTQSITINESSEPVTVNDISLNKEAVALAVGKSQYVEASAHLSDFNQEDITESGNWSSDDASVATVNKGKISGVAEGETTINIEKEGVTASIPVKVWDDQDFDDVWLYEDFNNIPDGELPDGWDVQLNGTWSVEDGRLKGESTTHSPYEDIAIITLPYDLDSGDYVFEADVSFESVNASTRYNSLMFRVQEDAASYLQFAVRQGLAINQTELAARSVPPKSGWDVREAQSFGKDLELNETYHYKVVASNDRFQGFIDNKMVIDSDKIDDVLKGGLGLQSSGAVTYFDNVKVTINQEELPPVETHDPFVPEQPETGLVLPPTVIAQNPASMNDLETWAGSGVTSIFADVELHHDRLRVISDNQDIGSLDDFLASAEEKLIPILRIEDMETANKVTDYLLMKQITDLHVISSQPEIVKEMRTKNASLRGGLMYSASTLDSDQLRQVEKEAHSSKANAVIINKQAATAEAIQYLQARGLVVWVMDAKTVKEIHTVIHNGANGILSPQPSIVIDALGKYEAATIAHHQMLVAHRGNTSYTHENTLDAFKESTKLGADVIEFDLYRSKDGELFVWHDRSFSDEYGGGTPEDRDYYGDIDQIDLDGNGAKVPTFKETLQVIKENSDTAIAFPETKIRGTVEQYNDIVMETGMEDRVVHQSFSTEDLQKMHEINPDIGTLYLVSGTKEEGTYSEAKEEFDFLTEINSIYGPNYKRIYPSLREYGVMRGLVLWPWTLKNPEDTAEQARLGTHAIMTDYADDVTDAPIRIEAEKTVITLDVDGSTNIMVNQLFRNEESESVEPSELIVIEGKDVVETNGNMITALQNGTALVMAKKEITFSGEPFYMYTEPIEISVGNDAPADEIAQLIDHYIDSGDINNTFGTDLKARMDTILILLERKENQEAINYLQDLLNHVNDPSVRQQGLISEEAANTINEKVNALIEEMQS